MTKREIWAVSICIAIAVIYTGVMSIVGDARISRLQDRSGIQQARIVELENQMLDLQCRHVRFEDGSTKHADAEVTAECVYAKGE